MLAPWKKSYDKPRQHIKKQRYHLADKGPYSQRCGFSSGHICMWKLDHKEGWEPKNWYLWTVVLAKTLESPLDTKIKLVNPKGNQSWIFIGRTDAEAEVPILWPPDVKNWLIGKDPDAGKDWRQEEKGVTEDKMVGWHHQLNGHEFKQAPGAGDGQGSLVCCTPWGHKESDMTEQLNWTWNCTLLYIQIKCYFNLKCFWISRKSMNWYDVGTIYTWVNSLPHEFVNTENWFCGPENCSLSQPSSIFNIPENSVIQTDKNKTKTKSTEWRKKEKQRKKMKKERKTSVKL